MENRFFDIDSNIYLNSIYILSTIYKSDKVLSIKSLLLSLYLIKNPSICLMLLDKKSRISLQKYIKSYELNNIQSEMTKYTSKIFNDGFNEALVFLFSKDIIKYEINSNVICRSEEFNNLNFNKFPKDLICKASYVNKIMNNYSQIELESRINDLWKELI